MQQSIILTEKGDPEICCGVGPRGGATLKVGLQVTVRGVNYRPGPQDLPRFDK